MDITKLYFQKHILTDVYNISAANYILRVFLVTMRGKKSESVNNR